MDITWDDLHQRDLSTRDLYDVLALRNRVFVVEQACAYQDVDGLDLAGDNRHLLGRLDGLVAYARLLAPDAHGSARIGRVVVGEPARGRQLGRRLVQTAVAACLDHWPQAAVELSAQAHLQALYASLGFVATGPVYDEDGIDHVEMRLVTG